MAKVVWSAGIDFVSGALSKPGKGQHSCAKMLLATHRVAATTNPDCNRIYLRKKIKYALPMSADARAARQRFAQVAAAVKARKENVSTLTSDMIAFQAQKETGIKTFKAYLWKVCGDAYDESQG